MAQQTFKDTKINVEFDEATSRQQLNSGDNISTLFGKIKKIFSDLKSVCFSGSYKDLNDTPTTATADTDGLMSATDKTKLNGIATGANKYTHPSYTAKSSGLYKVTVDATGHVSATTAVAKSDITNLGIPAQDTTYSNMTGATSSAAGKAGLVPAPAAGKQTSFLRGDGTWSVPGLGAYLPLSGGTTTGSTALANNFRVVAGDYTRIQFLFNDTWSTVIWGDNTNSGLILGSSSAKRVALTVDDPAHAYVNNYPIYSGGYKPYLTGYFSMGTTNKTITCNFKPSFVVIFNAAAGGSAHFVYFSDGTNTAITITNTGFTLNVDYVASSITYGYIAFR